MRKEYRMVGIDPKLHTELKLFCVIKGITMTSLVENLVKEHMSKHGGLQGLKAAEANANGKG